MWKGREPERTWWCWIGTGHVNTNHDFPDRKTDDSQIERLDREKQQQQQVWEMAENRER